VAYVYKDRRMYNSYKEILLHRTEIIRKMEITEPEMKHYL